MPGMLRESGVSEFFAYARERHSTYLRRAAGRPAPWTDDPVIQQFRFTNVFRELDRTTIWCREHVRDHYDLRQEILPAVVLFRWFNRIETGEAMFSRCVEVPGGHGTTVPFDYWMQGNSGGVDMLRRSVIQHVGEVGPFTNAAYIVKSPDGMSKLDGVLFTAEKFRITHQEGPDGQRHGWKSAAYSMLQDRWSLEGTWNWVREHAFQGDFTAYEVVTDLRHTYLLRSAADIMTWANAGPGAVRGLNRIQGRPVRCTLEKRTSLEEMRWLLLEAMEGRYWPIDWPAWEMRDVEHTLCEFDKWVRVRRGEGRAKQKYDARTAHALHRGT